MSDSSESVGLAGAIEALRSELETAWQAGKERPIRFRATAVTLKVQVTARREAAGSAKIRWWLVEAGAGAKAGVEATQTLEITLTPSLRDSDGNSGPLDVAAPQARPGD